MMRDSVLDLGLVVSLPEAYQRKRWAVMTPGYLPTATWVVGGIMHSVRIDQTKEERLADSLVAQSLQTMIRCQAVILGDTVSVLYGQIAATHYYGRTPIPFRFETYVPARGERPAFVIWGNAPDSLRLREQISAMSSLLFLGMRKK
jgi:hypothetical protein